MRFISADTIVPQPENPQTLNRYSYGLNNPAKYIDPTGHCSEFNQNENYQDCLNLAEAIQSDYRVSVENYQTLEIWDITALTNLQGGLSKFRGAIGQNAFDKLFPGTSVTFKYDALLPAAHWDDGSITLAQANFLGRADMFQMTVVHELAHGLFERVSGGTKRVIADKFVPAAGWKGFDLLPRQLCSSFGICLPKLWLNPKDGPTEYARGELKTRPYVVPEEDAADTFAALVVAGTADYPVTSGRIQWFKELISEVKK